MKRFAASLAGLLIVSSAAGAEEFSFDSSEFDKKMVEFSGYFEQKEEALKLRSGTPAYRLNYPGEADKDHLLRSTSTLETSVRLNLDPLVADVRAQAAVAHDALVSTHLPAKVMEGGVRWSAGPGLTFDLGKRVQRWGKGYAWSPVGFVERPKDAADPQASREGFLMASGEWTKSFLEESNGGVLSAIGLTGLIVPTNDSMNPDFGSTRHLNPAAKLYLLAWDTDIDLLWRGKGARAQSVGVDFSRNLTPALEVHGEWAHTYDAPRTMLSASGVISSRNSDFNSSLFGIRYITQSEVTWIGEYYRNGAGYRPHEMENYYQFLDRALDSSAAPALEYKARTLAQSGYGKVNPGRDYLYLKASVSEPLGWVYGSAALTAMTNLRDGSWQLVPELSYTGYNNIELRARLLFLGGPSESEFYEKVASRRLEVYARFFF